MNVKYHTPLTVRQVAIAMFLRVSYQLPAKQIADELGVCPTLIRRLDLPPRDHKPKPATSGTRKPKAPHWWRKRKPTP